MKANRPFIVRMQTALTETLRSIVGNQALALGRSHVTAHQTSFPPYNFTAQREVAPDDHLRVIVEYDCRRSVTLKDNKVDFRLAFLPVNGLLAEARWQSHTVRCDNVAPEAVASVVASYIFEFLYQAKPAVDYDVLVSRIAQFR